MTHTSPTAAGKRKVVETLTAGPILIALIEGAVNGTFGAVFNRVTDWLLPPVTSHSTTHTAPKKETSGGSGGPAGKTVSPPSSISTTVASPAGTEAYQYIGTLAAFTSSVSVDNYNLIPSADTDRDKCVETTVISGLAPGVASVYALGLPTGLSAAESVPPQTPTDGAVHQQVVLLSGLKAGAILKVGASVTYQGQSHILGASTAEVRSVQDGQAVLAVNGKEVKCRT